MTRIISETRSIRNGLETYLSSSGWVGLGFSEGWDTKLDLTNPLVNVYIIDQGKEELELGRGTTHKLYNRVPQIDVYMESEARVKAICEDIMDYFDMNTIEIKDIESEQVIGYAVCPDSSSIRSDFMPPVLNDPVLLRWRGIVRGDFEMYYPNGGSPF